MAVFHYLEACSLICENGILSAQPVNTASASSCPLDQTTFSYLINKKYATKDSHQLQITDALVSFVGEDLTSLSVVETHMLDPKYQIPSRKQLSSVLIVHKYEPLQTVVKDQLMKSITRTSL